ncbi:hypothetical protein AC233_24310 [Burkholderia sp. HB1]|uniref:DUF6232 family protein n=1 Tax=Paraburkholderia sp. RL17-368-BIF-A TaxID=3031628 RepID=UPI0006BC5386|nr:hypothetical protein AC233_24310 [Burkholderia sp. HB1]
MALVKCEECNKEVSQKAACCPHCGAPVDLYAQTGSASEADTRVFFNNRGVTVTGARFLLPGNRTFAMSGITAVRMWQKKPSRLGPILCAIVAALALSGKATIWSVAIPLSTGVLWFVLQKPTFYVVLSSASGETQVLRHKSRKWIQDIVAALNQAIIYRG